MIPNWGDTVDSIRTMSSDENYLLAAYSGLLLSKSHSYLFVADSISQTSFPRIIALRANEAHKQLCTSGEKICPNSIRDNCAFFI